MRAGDPEARAAPVADPAEGRRGAAVEVRPIRARQRPLERRAIPATRRKLVLAERRRQERPL